MEWPPEHPNGKVLGLVAEVRAELERERAVTPQAVRLRTILDEIERVVGEMRVGKTRQEIERLVCEVQLLVPHVHSILEVVRMQVRARGDG